MVLFWASFFFSPLWCTDLLKAPQDCGKANWSDTFLGDRSVNLSFSFLCEGFRIFISGVIKVEPLSADRKGRIMLLCPHQMTASPCMQPRLVLHWKTSQTTARRQDEIVLLFWHLRGFMRFFFWIVYDCTIHLMLNVCFHLSHIWYSLYIFWVEGKNNASMSLSVASFLKLWPLRYSRNVT